MSEAFSLLDVAPVMPVVVIDDAADAVLLARALVSGGIPVVELTLRTPAALDAIHAISVEVPEILVGAGTVVTGSQAKAAHEAGAQFLVSPGCTRELQVAVATTGLPYLPGVATVSDVLTLLESGIHEMKFFPAEASGGIPWLGSVAGPLPGVRFCPTGGIDANSARAYLAQPNVGCVGGSWIASRELIACAKWATVEALAREASALRLSAPGNPSLNS